MSKGVDAGSRITDLGYSFQTPGLMILLMVLCVFGGVFVFRQPSAPVVVVQKEESELHVIKDQGFLTGSYDLRPEQRADIESIAKTMNKDSQLLFLGFADIRRGKTLPNAELALKRAEAVASVFEANGFKNLRTMSVGDNGARLCKSGDAKDRDACLASDRRVEIHSQPK